MNRMPLVFQRAPPTLAARLGPFFLTGGPYQGTAGTPVYPRIRDPGLEDQPGAGPEQATDGQFAV